MLFVYRWLWDKNIHCVHHQLSNPRLPLSWGGDIRKTQLKGDHHARILFQCLLISSQIILMEGNLGEIVLPEHLLEAVRLRMPCLDVSVLKYSDLSYPVVLVNLLVNN